MWRKLLVGVLLILVLTCVGLVMFISFNPNKAEELAKQAADRTGVVVARRPPPRNPPAEPTPAPSPTPETDRIERRIRVSPSDYPFGIRDQRLQPDGQIRITLDIKNNSGKDWGTAYLVLSSAFHPEKSHYRINKWPMGDTRSIDYVFPAEEKELRLRELRIENVSSVPTSEVLSGTSTAPPTRESDSGGTLGLWSGLRDAAGVPAPSQADMAASVSESSSDAAQQLTHGTGLAINLDGLGDVDMTQLSLTEGAADSRNAREMYNQGIEAAGETIWNLKALGKILATQSWTEAMAAEGPGTQQLDAVRKSMNHFQEKAVALHQLSSRSSSEEIRQLLTRLQEASDVILTYQDALERQVRAAQPDFSID